MALILDETRNKEESKYGECIRLYQELLPSPQRTFQIIDISKTDGSMITITKPARIGVNALTSSFTEIKSHLDNPGAILSESTKQFLRKILRIRFNTEYQIEKNLVSQNLRNEYQLIDNTVKTLTADIQKIDFLGESGGGVFGEVRLDGSTKHASRIIKL